ncbi:MAG: selenium cofactor biosynthesis protein YqeC [Lachnospiraceae bacterium]
MELFSGGRKIPTCICIYKIMGEYGMEDFTFLQEKGHVISIVGAGGKTTLMYALARQFAENGMRTLVTTTTHIIRPEKGLWARSVEEAEGLWKRGAYAVVGQTSEQGKLEGLPLQKLSSYMKLADAVLIEADGARQMPCKVPAAHEPVLSEESDIVIGVMGMDAYGKTIGEACFRKKEALCLLGTDEEDLLTAERMAMILVSENGTRKNVGDREYVVVLNKCDTAERVQAAERIKKMLHNQGIHSCILTCYGEERLRIDGKR